MIIIRFFKWILVAFLWLIVLFFLVLICHGDMFSLYRPYVLLALILLNNSFCVIVGTVVKVTLFIL